MMLAPTARALADTPHAHPHLTLTPVAGCEWWNLLCQGGHKLADSGLSAITKAIAAGAASLMSNITRVLDTSTQVPLTDPTYRHIYTGFLGLAVPLVAVILLGALVVAGLRRDAATFGRAVVGIAVASLGGALFITFAQLLVAVDNWLAHGIVAVTGHDLTDGIESLATGFEHIAGTGGEIAANMLLILLMLIMLIAGIVLWFVLVLRQVGILVVVAFAPLLIAGWLWAPTRSWVRRATETLVALTFTKSAIYALFGIGLALLSHGAAGSIANFVGMVILLCGACFAPLVMLKLVHFAADSHLAGQMMGGLGEGARTAGHHTRRAASVHKTMGRSDIARHHAGSDQSTATHNGQGHGNPMSQGSGSGGTATSGLPGSGGTGGTPGSAAPSSGGGGGGPSAGPAGSGGSTGGSGSGSGTAAAGVGAAVGAAGTAAKTGVSSAQRTGASGAQGFDKIAPRSPGGPGKRERAHGTDDGQGPQMPGPSGQHLADSNEEGNRHDHT